ncbi:hypothetical protein FB451DRAFT_1372150 [Mycena latifolia]|nr:hypothetical protein FB451DRAFT_1372150 [Mycena latifolia]
MDDPHVACPLISVRPHEVEVRHRKAGLGEGMDMKWAREDPASRPFYAAYLPRSSRRRNMSISVPTLCSGVEPRSIFNSQYEVPAAEMPSLHCHAVYVTASERNARAGTTRCPARSRPRRPARPAPGLKMLKLTVATMCAQHPRGAHGAARAQRPGDRPRGGLPAQDDFCAPAPPAPAAPPPRFPRGARCGAREPTAPRRRRTRSSRLVRRAQAQNTHNNGNNANANGGGSSVVETAALPTVGGAASGAERRTPCSPRAPRPQQGARTTPGEKRMCELRRAPAGNPARVRRRPARRRRNTSACARRASLAGVLARVLAEPHVRPPSEAGVTRAAGARIQAGNGSGKAGNWADGAARGRMKRGEAEEDDGEKDRARDERFTRAVVVLHARGVLIPSISFPFGDRLSRPVFSLLLFTHSSPRLVRRFPRIGSVHSISELTALRSVRARPCPSPAPVLLGSSSLPPCTSAAPYALLRRPLPLTHSFPLSLPSLRPSRPRPFFYFIPPPFLARPPSSFVPGAPVCLLSKAVRASALLSHPQSPPFFFFVLRPVSTVAMVPAASRILHPPLLGNVLGWVFRCGRAVGDL